MVVVGVGMADLNDPFAWSLAEQLDRELLANGIAVKPGATADEKMQLLIEARVQPVVVSQESQDITPSGQTRRTVAAKNALKRRQLRLQRRG